jgi:hypothetical protein
VPVSHKAIITSGVHAHGRHDDAVGNGYAFQFKRSKHKSTSLQFSKALL